MSIGLDLTKAAARQQAARLTVAAYPGVISMHDGVLAHSGGDFNAVLLLLTLQGYANRYGHEGQNILPVTVLSRGNAGDAAQYTAGQNKRGLNLHHLDEPYRPIAFPPEDLPTFVKKFLTHLLTLTGNLMSTVFTPDYVRVFAENSFILSATKTFDPLTGEDVDELSARILGVAERSDIGTGFVAGYTGARAVFQENLPPLEGEKTNGLHIGLGVTNLDQGLSFASLLTGSPADQEAMVVGGAQVYTFKNLSLRWPLIVSVYDNPQLRKVQRLYSIYKNIFSVLNGRDLFVWIFERLKKAQGQVSADLIGEAEAYYAQLTQESHVEILNILSEIEGIPLDQLHVLPCTQQDAMVSWRVKDMGKICHAIATVFFPGKGSLRPGLNGFQTSWRAAMQQVFETRNPAAGACIAASIEAVRLGFVDDPLALLPRDVTFEGVNTTVYLNARLRPDQKEKLSLRVRTLIAELVPLRQSTVLPPQVRASLGLTASSLHKRQQGLPVMLSELKTGELVGEPMVSYEGALTFNDLIMAVQVSKDSLEKGIALIKGYSEKQTELIPIQEFVDRMIQGLNVLESVLRKKNENSPFEAAEVQKISHAFKLLLTEGDRLYFPEPLNRVQAQLEHRFRHMLAYLCEVPGVTSPYPSIGGKAPKLAPKKIEAAVKKMLAD